MGLEGEKIFFSPFGSRDLTFEGDLESIVFVGHRGV